MVISKNQYGKGLLNTFVRKIKDNKKPGIEPQSTKGCYLYHRKTVAESNYQGVETKTRVCQRCSRASSQPPIKGKKIVEIKKIKPIK